MTPTKIQDGVVGSSIPVIVFASKQLSIIIVTDTVQLSISQIHLSSNSIGGAYVDSGRGWMLKSAKMYRST